MEDEKSTRRITTCIALTKGVESVAADMKERKVSVIGDADPVSLCTLLRKKGFGTKLLSVVPERGEKKVGSRWDAENRGRNTYLGMQRTEAVGGFGGMDRAIEDNEASEKRIVEAVAGFGDFTSIEVDIKKGMVTVVGKSVPVSVALKAREMGYRAKLLSLGPATEEENTDEDCHRRRRYRRGHNNDLPCHRRRGYRRGHNDDLPCHKRRGYRRGHNDDLYPTISLRIRLFLCGFPLLLFVLYDKLFVLHDKFPRNYHYHKRAGLSFVRLLLFVTLLLAMAVQTVGSKWDTENRGRNLYLGMHRTEAIGGFGGMNRAIEDSVGSETRMMEAVAGFGDITSIEVDLKKGMVTVVGKSVPVGVALKVREMGYRAKLLSLGPATEEEDTDEEHSDDPCPTDPSYPYNHPTRPIDLPYPYHVVDENPTSHLPYPYHVVEENPYLPYPYHVVKKNPYRCTIA